VSEESTSAAESSWADGVDVRIARELIEKAKAEGVSLAGAGGLLSHITKTVMEAALNAELDEHLGYEKGDPAGRGSSRSRSAR
jgi:transposase-like protein